MAKVKRIMIHCTDEPDNVKRNRAYWEHWFFKVKGWKHFGYHAVVYQDGRWEELQPMPDPISDSGIITNATMANGCKGANSDTIHIAYVGGIDHVTKRRGDTRTIEQKKTLAALVGWLSEAYGIKEVIGHRDWPGVTKTCPNFDAKKTYAYVGDR